MPEGLSTEEAVQLALFRLSTAIRRTGTVSGLLSQAMRDTTDPDLRSAARSGIEKAFEELHKTESLLHRADHALLLAEDKSK